MSGVGGYVHWGGGYVWGGVKDKRGWVPTHPLLTPSGGHNTCGQQAGGKHPTGMLSCSTCFLISYSLQNKKCKRFVAEGLRQFISKGMSVSHSAMTCAI